MDIKMTTQNSPAKRVFIGAAIASLSLALALPSHAAHRVEYCKGKDPKRSPNDVMVKVGPLCVDKYEASVFSEPLGMGKVYPEGNPRFPSTFPENGNWTVPLYATSKPNVQPAKFITWFQAQQACALSGKRLLTNAEWQMAAAGTPDPGTRGDGVTTCNTNTTGSLETGKSDKSDNACVSNWGVSDMVGNLNEWVADWIQGPGGVSLASINPTWDPNGQKAASPEYGGDHSGGVNDSFHNNAPQTGTGPRAAINPFPGAIYRGGMWSSGSLAGVFMLDAQDAPSSLNNALGFRCAMPGHP